MSIKLRFENGQLLIQAVVKDEALPALLELVSLHQSDEPIPQATVPAASVGSIGDSVLPATQDRIATTKQWLSQHSPAEILNWVGWETYPEKILLLGALYEAKFDADNWRSADMDAMFSDAKEPPPANFPRDISKAIKSGIIATVTPRTYRVSRTGWNKIEEAVHSA